MKQVISDILIALGIRQENPFPADSSWIHGTIEEHKHALQHLSSVDLQKLLPDLGSSRYKAKRIAVLQLLNDRQNGLPPTHAPCLRVIDGGVS